VIADFGSSAVRPPAIKKAWTRHSRTWAAKIGRKAAEPAPQDFNGNLRDQRAVVRYASLTGTSDESGSKQRDQRISKEDNPQVRCGMIQLAWRFLVFQPNSVLVRCYKERAAGAKGGVRRTLTVAWRANC
jgi:transposase